MNSFKELEGISQQRFLEHSDQRVQQKLQSTMSTFRLIGHIVDIYLPCMVDTIVALIGGPEADAGTSESAPRTKGPTPAPTAPSGPVRWRDPERG